MVQENNNEPEELVGEELTLGRQVDALLEKGYSQKECREQGFSPSLVRQRVRKRSKRLGLLAPESKTNGNGDKPGVALTINEKQQVLPEWLGSQVGELYDGDEKTRKIFMAGMSIPLLGMRLFAESFKPMLSLMQTYQQGQAEAVKASQGAADDVAEKTVVAALPYMERMVKESSRASSPNPMAAMLSRILEAPMTQVMSGIFNMFMPQAGGQGQQTPRQSTLPPGWTSSEKK
jgi:hypothetical protein